MTRLLCLIFFLSGAAALLFETLWFHQAGLALGNTVWASSLVLAGFMGGLALGSGLAGRLGHRLRRRVRAYAGLELWIGASGLALVLLLPVLTPILAPVLAPFRDAPWLLNPLRLAIAFALLLAPSTAMGATLPLLVLELCARDPRFGRALGQLYGWNTLGAVAGAVAGHVGLLAWLGVRGTAGVAAGANVLAAALALGLARRAGPPAGALAAPPPVNRLTARAGALLAAAFVTGAAVLALEVVWFRFLLLFVLGGSLAFALMLAIVLAGIGLGGLLAAAWLSRSAGVHRHVPALALAAGALCVATYALFDLVAAPLATRVVYRWPGMLALGVPLMLPVSLVSGVLFTVLGDAVERESRGAGRAAGFLVVANTAGAMTGALLGGFGLLSGLGIEASIRALAAAFGATALLAALGGARPRGASGAAPLALAVAGFAAAIGLFPSGLLREHYIQYPVRRMAAREGSHLVAAREGLTETVLYLRKDRYGEPEYWRLVTNSHSMSTTALKARRYMQLFVYWPIAVHPDPRHALLISYGVGATAKALVQTRALETIDVVDVSRDILELSELVFPDPREHPLRDPRVRVHVEDGRFFLQTTDRRYDLVTGEPPPPKAAGIVSLFTREHFRLIRERLAPGGIATYWLPAHSLRERESKAVIRAFCEVFADCSLWNGADLDWILVGTRDAAGPVSPERFAAQWNDPVVGPELVRLGVERPEQLGALFLADAEALRALTRDTPPVVDDRPKRIGEKPMTASVRPGYRRWTAPGPARERFAESALVRRLWPPEMARATLPWFEAQALVNVSLGPDFAGPGVRLRRVHELLTETALVTLPLWQLGHHADTQRAARDALRAGHRGSALDAELAAGALARRNYAEAARLYARASERATPLRHILWWRLYALCMAGRPADAARVARAAGVPHGAERGDDAAWSFLAETFPRLLAAERAAPTAGAGR